MNTKYILDTFYTISPEEIVLVKYDVYDGYRTVTHLVPAHKMIDKRNRNI